MLFVNKHPWMGKYELRPAVKNLYHLHPKVSALRVSVASRVVHPKHDELRPAVSKELHPLHRKTRVYKMPNNWKVLVYKSQQHAQVGIYVLEYYYDARTHEH